MCWPAQKGENFWIITEADRSVTNVELHISNFMLSLQKWWVAEDSLVPQRFRVGELHIFESQPCASPGVHSSPPVASRPCGSSPRGKFTWRCKPPKTVTSQPFGKKSHSLLLTPYFNIRTISCTIKVELNRFAESVRLCPQS